MTITEQSTADSAALREGAVSTDDRCDALSNARRRSVIARRATQSRPLAVVDVSRERTRWEHETPSDQTPEEHVGSRSVALSRVHVPTMADVGILEYGQERNTIAHAAERDGITSVVSHRPSDDPAFRTGGESGRYE